jgi:hypothetical protein
MLYDLTVHRSLRLRRLRRSYHLVRHDLDPFSLLDRPIASRPNAASRGRPMTRSPAQPAEALPALSPPRWSVTHFRQPTKSTCSSLGLTVRFVVLRRGRPARDRSGREEAVGIRLLRLPTLGGTRVAGAAGRAAGRSHPGGRRNRRACRLGCRSIADACCLCLRARPRDFAGATALLFALAWHAGRLLLPTRTAA